MTTPDLDPHRRAQLSANLVAVRQRISAACAVARRDPAEVTLIAVTKTYPATDVLHLAALGVADVGENREQEATPKSAEVRAAGVDLRWHHIGQLQRNKARPVAAYAGMVHSVDRPQLVTALGVARRRLRDEAGFPVLDVLVQVDLDEHVDPTRGGAAVAEVAAVAAAVAGEPALRLAGVMAVAPLDADPRAAFDRLAGIAAELWGTYPSASVISAGMSTDFEAAIACGATHVRVGAALLGTRAKLG